MIRRTPRIVVVKVTDTAWRFVWAEGPGIGEHAHIEGRSWFDGTRAEADAHVRAHGFDLFDPQRDWS